MGAGPCCARHCTGRPNEPRAIDTTGTTRIYPTAVAVPASVGARPRSSESRARQRSTRRDDSDNNVGDADHCQLTPSGHSVQASIGRSGCRSSGRAPHGRGARSPHGWVYGVPTNDSGMPERREHAVKHDVTLSIELTLKWRPKLMDKVRPRTMSTNRRIACGSGIARCVIQLDAFAPDEAAEPLDELA